MPDSVIKQGFILNKGTFHRKGKVYVELWVRTDEGAVRLVSPAQYPSCFVASDQVETLKQKATSLVNKLKLSDDGFTTLEQVAVTTIKSTAETAMHQLRQLAFAEGITLYEADIRLADRFLMERFIYGSVEFIQSARSNSSHKEAEPITIENAQVRPGQYRCTFSALSIDIECNEHEDLFSIALASKHVNEVILVRPPTTEIKSGKIDGRLPFNLTVVESEKALLETFFNHVEHIDPDVLLGWNVKQFDMAVIARRSNLHRLKFNIGRQQREATVRAWEDQTLVDVPGRCVIDGIEALKTMTYHFESFSLDHVSESLLGENKLIQSDNKLEAIKQLYHADPLALAQYNFKDTVLVNRIEEKTHFIDFLALRSALTGLDLSRPGGSVAAFLNVYLPKLHRKGYVAGVRPENGGLASPGGYVMRSQPGLYKDVLVLDFKSLYPSIIRTFKIDPYGLAEGLKDPTNAIAGFKGAVFSRTNHFLPDIIENLWLQRDEAKKQKDAPRSQAIKILMNSFYGVLGSGGCPFYDPRLASSITLRGHEIMQTTAQWIEELGYTVIYGDTDSTFVHVEGVNTLGDAKETGAKLAQIINRKWQEELSRRFAIDCHLEIEFESHFSTFFMPTIRGSSEGSKKRYAGVKTVVNQGQQVDTLIFKGLENVRSDWTAMAKTFQYELYQRVFSQMPVENYIQQTIQKIRSGMADSELIYRKRLRKPLASYTKTLPPHVKAAKQADEINAQQGSPLRYQSNTSIAYVITLQGPQTIEHTQAPLDYDHYIEKQIKPIADSLLPLIGLDFEHIVNDQLSLF
ncbi:DNA polymerase II [Alteromonas sp. D210916BOD_24]|uniref:DNA polymerase II n=1 Tax=Alteromonas sp. D210916BOD_24 TaxID=3157618 RepID=UPI00399C5B16